uniref:Homeobox domain-containing protein n=1 Tax=Pelusios castaneus TaxID=367368 RepID=A0A8C8R897_9SAUR
MEKGSFSVEWLARSSHERAQPASRAGLSSTHHVPREASRQPQPQGAGEGSVSEITSCAQPGRPRTKFSASQLQELERSFREQRYIGASEKRRLNNFLDFYFQIKTWFQNRRMKFKRQTQDARVEALFSGLLLPYHRYPEFQSPSYLSGVEFSVSSSPAAAVTCSLHPAMPSPALLLPSTPTQSLQPKGVDFAKVLPSLPPIPVMLPSKPHIFMKTSKF